MKNTTINISDMNLNGKEFVATFTATYHLPIQWLAEKGIIKVDSTNNYNVNRLVIEYFQGQMFSDAIGRIPDEHYTLCSVNGYDDIQKEINHRIVLAIAEQKKKEEESRLTAEQEQEILARVAAGQSREETEAEIRKKYGKGRKTRMRKSKRRKTLRRK